MQIQEKVQNGERRMTRENLILAKAIGTLYAIGYDRNVTAEIAAKAQEKDTETLPYLKDRLLVIRSSYDAASEEYTALGALIRDCENAQAKHTPKEQL